MLKLQSKHVYLAALERQDYKKICEDNEYDFINPMEPTLFGWSDGIGIAKITNRGKGYGTEALRLISWVCIR